jgi:hypothetical protein
VPKISFEGDDEDEYVGNRPVAELATREVGSGNPGCEPRPVGPAEDPLRAADERRSMIAG